MTHMSAFDDLQAISPQQLVDGFLARAVHGDQLTLAVVEIGPGKDLPEHQHSNEQFGMVIEGSLTFRIGEEMQTLFLLEGVIQYLDDDNRVNYQDDVFTKLERYHKYCRENGLQPVDLCY